jgi:uncharacterized phage protein (TIGR02220 family)
MARIRTIKPDFHSDEKICALPPIARQLFIGLWNYADDKGLLKLNPFEHKIKILPTDRVEILDLLEMMEILNLIEIRRADDHYYIMKVKNLNKHQYISKPTASELLEQFECSEKSSIEHFKIEQLITIPGEVPERSCQLPEDSCGKEGRKEGRKGKIGRQNTGANAPAAFASLLGCRPTTRVYNAQAREDGEATPAEKKKSFFKNEAIEVLNFLNEKTGKAFRPTPTNLDFIIGRLRDGMTSDNLRAIIAIQFREWKGTDMEQFLRPSTLFNKTKCEQYYGKLQINKATERKDDSEEMSRV